ncbi:glycosyltransferase [Aliiglaciecola sp.]|nr:glycosyltransferase [Aliiglaciecola sp.]
MMTNTYLPHVGGVARSVSAFSNMYRKLGHNVLVVAPEFPNMPEREEHVIRIPAIQRFNGTDFSVVLPVPHFLGAAVEEFEPDIVHSHHPFLVGSIAARIASTYELPLVFTHHTMYERYTHYVPGDSDTLKRFVIKLATSYANLCDLVFAPSESIETLLLKRQVTSPIKVLPTGVDLTSFAKGDGKSFRKAMNIPIDAFVVGHLGRLAPEKNLTFLSEALIDFLHVTPQAHFLLIGKGNATKQIQNTFKLGGLSARLHYVPTLHQPLLSSAYKAMDVFVFSSHSETQGMVLTEAFAAGVPVIALDAPGAREVVKDNSNGRLLPANSDKKHFADAIADYLNQPNKIKTNFKSSAYDTAKKFSIEQSAVLALNGYANILGKNYAHRPKEHQLLAELSHLIKIEWELFANIASAAADAVSEPDSDSKQ